MSDSVIEITSLDFHWPTADPFLFCAFHQDNFPRGNGELGPDASLAGRNIGQDFTKQDGWRMYHGDRVPGFPGHPHRGFETITVVKKGLVDHADSLGAAGRYGDGDVQWMTAGKGIQHSEMFPLLKKDTENPLLLFQVWLNLPAASKMVEPLFTMFWNEDIPVISTEDAKGNKISIEVIAGRLDDISALSPPPDSWASETESHVAVWLIDIDTDASWTLPAGAPGLNRMLYFYDGDSLFIGDKTVEASHGIRLQSDLETTIKAIDGKARLLMLQGKPIGEPVAHYGPFVMNTREELQQAFIDYQRNQFGGWPWERNDQVHGERGRFARYADGREEVPEKKS
ncbi:MAG: pirin family protein [Gammaproteobacteria bacterium]|nr:pirin family protein [Gammaproteobacteria bacterium]